MAQAVSEQCVSISNVYYSVETLNYDEIDMHMIMFKA